MSWICRGLAALVVSFAWAGSSTALDLNDAVRFDGKVALPVGAHPLEEYIRYYASADIQTQDDLPFTSMRGDFKVKPGELVLGILVLPGEFGIDGVPGVRVAETVADLPYAVHGGCRAVNVVADSDGEMLGSWCNVDQETALPPAPKARFR